MTTFDVETTVTGSRLVSAQRIGGLPDSMLASDQREAHRAAWFGVIDMLRRWYEHPELISSPDFPVPPSASVSAAIDAANRLVRLEDVVEAPSHVGPSIDGGIVWEWRHGDSVRVVDFDERGVEMTVIADGHTVSHRILAESPQASV